MTVPRTLFEKIWDRHVVAQAPDSPAVLYVDLHLVHEVTSPQAFQGLRERGLKVRRPDKTFATLDHSIPTDARAFPIADKIAAKQIAQMEDNGRDFGVKLFGLNDPRRGIVHIIGPELGLTQPATPPRTARSARWRSVSARARWSTFWRRSASCRTSPRRCSSASTARCRAG